MRACRLRFAGMVAAVVVSTACASTGVAPRPFPVPPGATPPPTGAPSDPRRPADRPADSPVSPTPLPRASLVVETALALVGSPYRDGGSTPAGFDCSGFTQWVFAQHGLQLPRQTRDQFDIGDDIETGDIAAGDLVFFSTVASGASHVAIALDDDRFVHAPSARGVVRIERRSTAYWRQRYVGARRVPPRETDGGTRHQPPR